MNLTKLLIEFQQIVDLKCPARKDQWVEGLSRRQVDEVLYSVLKDKLPYHITNELYDLWRWSNGYMWHEFNGTFYEGLHEHTIGSYNYSGSNPTLSEIDGLGFYCSLAMFSDGEGFGYDIPLTTTEREVSPLYFYDANMGGGELCFESLYGFFASSVEAKKVGVPVPTPFVSDSRTIEIARHYNPSVELWRRGHRKFRDGELDGYE